MVAVPLPDAVLGDGEAEVGPGAWTKLHQRHRHVNVIPGDRHQHHDSHGTQQPSTLNADPPHRPAVRSHRPHSIPQLVLY